MNEKKTLDKYFKDFNSLLKLETNRNFNEIMQVKKEFIKKFAPFVHEENIFLIVGELEKSNRYLKRNANAKILFYSISLKMIKYLKLKRKFVNKD